MNYPENDTQFNTHTIAKVSPGSFEMDDGFSLGMPKESAIEPAVGMSVRLYGKGFGGRIRGLFLNGERVYYRTEREDDEQFEIDMYGKDCADWLHRWDSDQSVWSISMGGLGPGYEQAIQVAVVEILRHLLEKNYDFNLWELDKESWTRDREAIEKFSFADKTISDLQLSGAMWGAAMSLALQFYRRGPRALMRDEQVKDRHIQARKNFPCAIGSTEQNRLSKAERILEDLGYRRCNIAVCTCGSYHMQEQEP